MDRNGGAGEGAKSKKGEEVVIARAGKPIARLVPNDSAPKVPVFGADRGTFTVPEDFDSTLAVSAFEGEKR